MSCHVSWVSLFCFVFIFFSLIRKSITFSKQTLLSEIFIAVFKSEFIKQGLEDRFDCVKEARGEKKNYITVPNTATAFSIGVKRRNLLSTVCVRCVKLS